MNEGKRWMVRDRHGNSIYLTNERWEHIIDPVNHPEMSEFDNHLKETIRSGIRKQDKLSPQKYRYVMPFNDLTGNNTHMVAIVLFRFGANDFGNPLPNNYSVIAYQKEVR
ncbi:hypothetical protein D1AOALGA4SA_3675 [Olavius algarvensis Delta 1 endosymbiont]|nr:hypothetical protein D1AOALGA4SA_3675 [Olavius algarvensis Delta 1 endosymbiont]